MAGSILELLEGYTDEKEIKIEGRWKMGRGFFTNEEILQIAMRQSAIDANCNIDDFYKNENVVVASEMNKSARKYLKLPLDCNLISYGNNSEESGFPCLHGKPFDEQPHRDDSRDGIILWHQ